MNRLSTALSVVAVVLAIAIVILIVGRDPSIAPGAPGRHSGIATSSGSSNVVDPCRSISSEVDLIARHAACEAACTKDDMPACGLAATDFVTGLGAPPDGARAVELYEKACASTKAPSACLLLGDLLNDGALVTRNADSANHAWLRGCAQQDRASCSRLDGGR